MKRLLTGLATASLLIGLPLAAAADDDRGRGWERHGHHGYWKGPKHVRHYYYPAPPVVYYPAPRVVYRTVYVPAPVVARPVYVPPPPPVVDGPRVSVGFRIFF
jgi:hypothetical protein